MASLASIINVRAIPPVVLRKESLLGATRLRTVMTLTFAALLGGACVPTVRYEEAQSAAEVEAEARRRTLAELKRARADVARLEAELRARNEMLDESDGTLHEAKLEQDRVSKERDESALLIEQLRGELARVGGHLQQSVDEKSRLERELSDARAANEAQTRDRLVLVRDLSLALGAARLQNAVRLGFEADAVVIRIAAENLFEPNAATLRPTFATLRGLLNRARAIRGWNGAVREAEVEAGAPPSLGEERRQELRGLIAEQSTGLPVSYDGEASGTPRYYELVLRQSGTSG